MHIFDSTIYICFLINISQTAYVFIYFIISHIDKYKTFLVKFQWIILTLLSSFIIAVYTF
jgi:hypothetical protein